MNNIDNEIKNVKTIQENLKKIDGSHAYTFKELFNDEFMAINTKLSNISDFLEASGLDFSSQEAFKNVDISKLDEYVSKNSIFSSWDEMKSSAAKMLLSKQIFN